MLIAYIDEVGEAGAFISKNHPRFNISPVFGYAGFIVGLRVKMCVWLGVSRGLDLAFLNAD